MIRVFLQIFGQSCKKHGVLMRREIGSAGDAADALAEFGQLGRHFLPLPGGFFLAGQRMTFGIIEIAGRGRCRDLEAEIFLALQQIFERAGPGPMALQHLLPRAIDDFLRRPPHEDGLLGLSHHAPNKIHDTPTQFFFLVGRNLFFARSAGCFAAAGQLHRHPPGIALGDAQVGMALAEMRGQRPQREKTQPVAVTPKFGEAAVELGQIGGQNLAVGAGFGIELLGHGVQQLGRGCGSDGDAIATLASFFAPHAQRVLDEHILADDQIGGGDECCGRGPGRENGGAAIILPQAQHHRHEIGIAGKDDELIEMRGMDQRIQDIHHHVDVGAVFALRGQRGAIHHREGGAGEIGTVLLKAPRIQVALTNENIPLLLLKSLGPGHAGHSLFQPFQPVRRIGCKLFRCILIQLTQPQVDIVEIHEQRGFQTFLFGHKNFLDRFEWALTSVSKQKNCCNCTGALLACPPHRKKGRCQKYPFDPSGLHGFLLGARALQIVKDAFLTISPHKHEKTQEKRFHQQVYT